jgi:hypothetical protein
MRSLSYSGITSRCCSSPAYSRPGRFMRPPSSSAAQRSDSPTHAAYTRSVVAVKPLHAVDQRDHVGEGEVPAADPTAAAPHRHHVPADVRQIGDVLQRHGRALCHHRAPPFQLRARGCG